MANEIAKEILAQLGGNQFVAMTGAKNLLAGADSLSMKIGSNPKGITHVRIVLTAMDLYNVEFLKIRGTTTHKTAAKIEGIYNDQLRATFTQNTGLYTSLRG